MSLATARSVRPSPSTSIGDTPSVFWPSEPRWRGSSPDPEAADTSVNFPGHHCGTTGKGALEVHWRDHTPDARHRSCIPPGRRCPETSEHNSQQTGPGRRRCPCRKGRRGAPILRIPPRPRDAVTSVNFPRPSLWNRRARQPLVIRTSEDHRCHSRPSPRPSRMGDIQPRSRRHVGEFPAPSF